MAFQPLTVGLFFRPVLWSKSSVIYTAHETEPRVVGRHFPSSRQFYLPPPSFHFPIESYEPPTVLSICPTDDWMFAYFPGKGVDGLGCVWHREAQVDRWTAVDSFTYPVGAGVVTATWTCSHREVRAIYTLHSSALSHARNSGLCLIPARQVAYLHSALRHLTEARC